MPDPKEERAAIKKRIKHARRGAGLTQQDLADILVVHLRTIQNWESKKTAAPYEHLGQIAQTTGVTQEWLLLGGDTPDQPAWVSTELQAITSAVQRLRQIREDQGRILKRLARIETALADIEGALDEKAKALDPLRDGGA